MNRPAFLAAGKLMEETTFGILFALSFAHLLNDMMQALLPAVYPILRSGLDLSFAQVGFRRSSIS